MAAAAAIPHTGLFIDNLFRDAEGGATFPTHDPATGALLARVAHASAGDVDAAVRAAARAFASGPWPALDGKGRCALLLRLAALVERDAEELARLEALDSGKPLRMARAADVASAVRVLRHHASMADAGGGAGGGRVLAPPASALPPPALALTLSAPIGVCAGVLPFNFPLCGAVAKLAPALAAGCCIVLKPSEQCPLSPLHLAALCAEAGVPPGVVGVVPGGKDTGAHLVAHALVRKVSFTGSTAVGKAIARVCSDRLARTTLELGGKNALVVAPDYEDMEEAARVACGANYFNAGQICVGMSRVFVPASRHDAFVAAAVRRARARVTGGQFEADTEMGPLVDERQMQRVLGLIAEGVAGGATVACGGQRLGSVGCFVAPTVLTGVTDENVCARVEIFGPVMCVLAYSDSGGLEEAFARANSTGFGLAATLLTRSNATALRGARALTAGTVWINTHGVFDPSVPYGGLKESGWGREYGEEGLDAYLEHKTVVLA